jgi:hypothetical protein
MIDGFSYLGLNEDGLAVAIGIDDPEDKEGTAEIVGEFVKDGLSILRLPHKEALERLKRDWAEVKARRTKTAEASA